MTQGDSASLRAIPNSIDYPPALPVSERREEIAGAIRDHQVVIVAGETGSGKTTQIPKICMELGRGRAARIGHTQPRRLAARTVAQRIADELNSPLGELVGYQIRFTDSVSERTAIKLMTDGILLSELQRDRELSQYDTLIIDEAHERSLNIDFILGYLKQLLPRRPDLKLIITSATIDVERFSKHFDNAPVIEVSGRTFPVDVHYVGEIEDRDQGVTEQIAGLLDDIEAQRFGPRGDVLVFLPGEREIRELSHRLRGTERRQILPLYSRLSAAEQNRVFNPSGTGMRVVIATNVAETSVTVPGIRYVIDPGDARISRYSHRTRLQRLPIEPISQASANQRKGRCGRVSEGVCFRLYSEEDFERRPEFTDPEILRTNLAAVILRMLQLGLGKVSAFPFVDAPEPKMVRDGYRLLEELGAVSARGRLTALGQKMARLPIDPKLARMLLAAAESGCLAQILVIVSAMSIQDPRERPADKRAQADQSHARFNHPKSDFLAWLNLWRYYEEQRQTLSQNQLRKLCKREYLSFLRMREWREIHGQLTIACRQIGLKPAGRLPAAQDPKPRAEGDPAGENSVAETPVGDYDASQYASIHKALLAGLLGQVAQQDEGRTYNGTRSRKLQIFPGSGVARKPPKWLVAGEVVETSQVFARQCAAIEPDWLLRVNPYLLKRHHYEPSWQFRSGRVMAIERVTLFGLTISDGKRVHYGEIAPAESRQIMIRDGLVTGQFKAPPPFLKHNLSLIREVQDLESRVRRRDLLVDEEALFGFYNERLPDDCASAVALDKWLRSDAKAQKSLSLVREQILTRDPGDGLQEQFPSSLPVGDVAFRLTYQFEPGKSNDGVSVTVPLPLINRVPRYRFEWLVPGLLRDKCIALIKGLPKALRKQLVPVPDVVDAALSELSADDVDLCSALAAQLKRQTGVRVSPSDWDLERLEDFYRMNIRVVDDRNKLLAQGRDLEALIEQFRGATPAASAASKSSPARKAITSWDFGELPEVWKSRSAGMEVHAYPALVDHGDRVDIELLDYPNEADLAHRRGFAALAMRNSAQTVRYLRKELLASNEAALALAGAGLERGAVVKDITMAALLSCLDDGARLPRDEAGFTAALSSTRGAWVPQAQTIERAILNCLTSVAKARSQLVRLDAKSYKDSRLDIEVQLAGLFGDEHIMATPSVWLEQYPRYGKALLHRVERLSGQYPKDQKAMADLAPCLERLRVALDRYPGLLQLCDAAQQYRWMLEEFRVSLFAQQLGTRVAVSIKRLGEQWRQVEQWLADNPR